MNAEDVIREARAMLGTPFRHQGRDARGIDCVGVPIAALQRLNALPPEFVSPAYGRLPTGEIVERIKTYCTRIDAPVPGCLIVIAWKNVAAHVAVFTGDTLIHAYERIGRVVEHGYRGRWVRLTHSAWLLPGVTYE